MLIIDFPTLTMVIYPIFSKCSPNFEKHGEARPQLTAPLEMSPIYPLVSVYSVLLSIAISSRFTHGKIVIFHGYVGLPKGNYGDTFHLIHS